MTSPKQLLLMALAVAVLVAPIVQSLQYRPNELQQKTRANAAAKRATKLQKVGATAKGLGKSAASLGVVLLAFKVLHIEKLFELMFGADTSAQDLQNEIMEKFDEVEELITSTTDKTITDVSDSLMMNTKLALHFEKIDKFLSYLKQQTDKMYIYLRISNNSLQMPNDETLVDYARSIVSRGNSSVLAQLNGIQQMLAYDSGDNLMENFFELYIKYLQRTPSNKLCHIRTSPQQTMFSLLKKLYKAELAALTLISYGYTILMEIKQKNGQDVEFVTEKEIAKQDFESYTEAIQIQMQYNLPRLDRNFWRCDAQSWKDGETYYQMNKLMYGVVEYEYNMAGSCYNDCSNLQKPHGLKFMDSWPNHKCSGWLSDCQSAKKKFQFCFTNDDDSVEMYSYVDNDVIKVGSKDKCGQRNITDVVSYISGFYRCEYCACLCYSEDVNTHRYLSLMPQMSDIADNQVIVGVQFIKKNKVLSLQIMQAPLLPYAGVNTTEAEWQDVPELELVPPKYWNYCGYHTFTRAHREIYMKELEVPDGTVLTGVKFIVKAHVVDLAIRFTYVDWNKGHLSPEKSYWITEKHDEYETNDMTYQNQRPDQCLTKSFIDTASGQKFRFAPSNLNQDAGQHVIPYIDAQPVVPHSMVPLSGIGLTHKADDKCAGFITPVVFTVHENYFLGTSKDDPF